MSDETLKTLITSELTKQEKMLFDYMLRKYKHIDIAHYSLVVSYCKLSIKLKGMEASRESANHTDKLRLLGKALEILPEKQQDVETDLALKLQQQVNDDKPD